MNIILKKIKIETKPICDLIDITKDVKNALAETKLKDGIVCIHIPGSTASISTIEFEPGLVKTDVKQLMEQLIPYDRDYAHHQTWNDKNGAGHLRSFLLKTSLTIPFTNSELILGTWQQIVFIEFDEKPRSRTIYCQFIGK